jgi:squalene synthase HpnC
LLDTTAHYENFPVGSWLVPRRLRAAYAAIYRFARYADDVADEGDVSDAERLAELDRLEKSLRGEANHPIVTQVIPHITAHKLNSACLSRLISAFSQDIQKKRYQNIEELLNYCEGSANPVGELVLGLFASESGQLLTTTEHLARSDQICSALQLINFLQDMAIDWQKDRIYLPLDIAQQFGLQHETVEGLLAKSSQAKHIPLDVQGQALRQAIELFHAKTQSLLDSGRPLIKMVPLRLGLELRAICAGGQRVLDKLAANRFDPFASRPKLGLADVPSLVRLFFTATSPATVSAPNKKQ